VCRWARLGRRVAGGGEFGGGELGSPARNPAKRRRLRAIPWAGRKREVWRSFLASQRGSGRLLAAAEDDGHGGVLGYWELFHRRERGASQREKIGRGEIVARLASPGGLLGGLGGKQEVATACSEVQTRSSSRKETRCYFCKKPPGH
jgi:hypothetical protein